MFSCEFQILCKGFDLLEVRVTGMLDLGKCLFLDTYNLPTAVYMSSVQNPQPYCENLGQERFGGI